MISKTRAHLAVLGTNLFFAANFSLVKFISPSLVGPFALNLLRVGLSLILFWTLWIAGRSGAAIKKKDVGRFVLCGLTGVAINQMLFIKGLTLTSTIHASLLMLLTPILVTVFALWVLKERFGFYKAVGLALGIGGATMLVLQKEAGEQAANYLLGDALILTNAASYAIYLVIVKPLMKDYSPIHVIRWVFTIGFLMILPFSWNEITQVKWELFRWQHVAALTAVVFTGTFLAYYFNAYGLQHLGASVTGSYIYTQPLFAVLIATLIVGESLSIQKIIAGILIFIGVFMVSRK